MLKVIAIMPALNEEEKIAKVLIETKKYVHKIVVINDGSTDNTEKIAKKYAKVINHPKSRGYDRSIDDGFLEAYNLGADIFVTLDADGQLNPKDIEKVVEIIKRDEADVVSGIRTFKSRLMEHVFGLYTKLKLGVPDPLCGIKAYNRKVYEASGYFDNIKSIGTQLMFEANKLGFKIKTIPVEVYREERPSRFGRGIMANLKIFAAMIKTMIKYI
jgi:glycosyltransferase involved in cell wall biosynthesis